MAYSQQDPAWKNIKLGRSKTGWTIGSGGCFITAFCNVLSQYGRFYTPAQMNQLLLDKNLYGGTDGSDVSANTLHLLFPDIQYIGWVSWENTLNIDLNALKINDQIGKEGIVAIDYNLTQGGIQSHYCRLRGVDANGKVIIDDSLTGTRVVVSERYGNQSYAVVGCGFYYKQPPAPTTTTTTTATTFTTTTSTSHSTSTSQSTSTSTSTSQSTSSSSSTTTTLEQPINGLIARIIKWLINWWKERKNGN